MTAFFFIRLTFVLLILNHVTTSPAAAEQMTVTLQDGLQMAFERNEILRAARGDVDRAHTFVNEASGDRLPQIGAAATYNRDWKLPTSVLDGPSGPSRVTFGTKNNLNSSLTLRQALYAGGGVRRNGESPDSSSVPPVNRCGRFSNWFTQKWKPPSTICYSLESSFASANWRSTAPTETS